MSVSHHNVYPRRRSDSKCEAVAGSSLLSERFVSALMVYDHLAAGLLLPVATLVSVCWIADHNDDDVRDVGGASLFYDRVNGKLIQRGEHICGGLLCK
jgi:hypothetical protein